MALLAFSSHPATSSNVFAKIASFKHQPSRDPNSATAKTSPIISYRAIRPLHLPSPSSSSKSVVAKGAWQPKYVYPDPNPDFARTETAKFQVELMRRLSKNKETFGKDVEEVVSVCSEDLPAGVHLQAGSTTPVQIFPPVFISSAIFLPVTSRLLQNTNLPIRSPSRRCFPCSGLPFLFRSYFPYFLVQISPFWQPSKAPGNDRFVKAAGAPRTISEREENGGLDRPIFSNFLHKEYGGPGTLLVEPFTDMLLALKEKKLPGPPVAARAALLWAQNYVDRDWEIWSPDQASP
ncbi:hypothetical protein KSP40_PGU005156 [Platanthera guangdongensis]|uniref:Uncharacterized protein n=1 Tax=Platanthera guangdongensis TaxID=2320717 RepID=A0ABR2M0T9_9ASPA